jgi:hypothetical protein
MAKHHKPRKTRKNRDRAPPSPFAFAYTVKDAQAMGAPGRTLLYDMLKDGRLERVPDDPRTMITGASLRRLLGVKEFTAA